LELFNIFQVKIIFTSSDCQIFLRLRAFTYINVIKIPLEAISELGEEKNERE
jgi:hypothetical protein